MDSLMVKEQIIMFHAGFIAFAALSAGNLICFCVSISAPSMKATGILLCLFAWGYAMGGMFYTMQFDSKFVSQKRCKTGLIVLVVTIFCQFLLLGQISVDLGTWAPILLGTVVMITLIVILLVIYISFGNCFQWQLVKNCDSTETPTRDLTQTLLERGRDNERINIVIDNHNGLTDTGQRGDGQVENKHGEMGNGTCDEEIEHAS